MRFTTILLLVLLSATTVLKAQITSEPAMPVATKAVTILFASADEPRLKYYTADLYAHTGVIIEGKSEWQHVIGQWKQNEAQPKLSYKGNGLYELVISPDIATFYSVAPGEKVRRLAFVFRSADGSKQTNDLFIDVFEEGLAVDLKCSFDGDIFDQGTSYLWELTASADAQLALRFNGEIVTTGSGKTLSAQKSFSSPTQGWMVASAEKEGLTVKDSAFVFVREQSSMLALPAGVRKGISYPDDQSARLVLWAPKKSFVFVLGDFNNWAPDHHYQMNKDGDYHWLDITGLEKGKAYAFQYYLDGKTKIADPYACEISDPWNDHLIGVETYPGLLTYPNGKTTGIASVLQPTTASYQWETPNFSMPAKEKMVIYELLIRDFTSEHTYASVISRLDYLADLRINVLELMPVNEFEGNSSWGYNPAFYFAPDKYYGPRDQLKKLIDECHKRGIAVVIDMVLNHSYGQSPFVQMYMDNWTVTSDNPWYNVTSNFKNTSLSWGYDFNHDSQATRELVDSINSYWLNEYKVDGFRFDFTKGFSNTPYGASDWGSAYDAARVANLKRMADEIWKRNPRALVICEHLADNSEEKVLADYGMMLWGNMNYTYRDAACGKSADFSPGLFSTRGWSKPNLVTYMESHDEERVVYTAKNNGLSSGSYNIRDLATALQRQELNSLFFIPLPGPKMIWQFGELGYDYSIEYNGRTGEKPVLWSFTQNANRAKLFKVMAKLNYLKQNYEEFSPDQSDQALGGTVKWYRLTKGDRHVLAVGNFGLTESTTTISFPQTGTWYDYFGETTFSVSQPNTPITLPPGGYKLFSTREFSIPQIKLAVEDHPWPSKTIRHYPNPVDGRLFIESEEAFSLEIYNACGKRLKSCPIDHDLLNREIDVQELPQGLYLAKVKGSGTWQNIFRFTKR